MCCRSAVLGLVLLVLPACNFRIEPSWTPPGSREPTDGGLGANDAGLDGGQRLVEWCRVECAAVEDDEGKCSEVICVDATVCVDDPPCDQCVICRDE